MLSQILTTLRFGVLAVFGTLVSGCAAGAGGSTTPNLAEITALLSHGLANGERRVIYGLGDGQTEQVNSDPPTFIWTVKREAPQPPRPMGPAPYLSYTFEEVAPCQVRATIQMSGDDMKRTVAYDFQSLRGVVVESMTGDLSNKFAAHFGVNGIWVKFDPPLPGEYEGVASQFFTSMDRADVQAAADQLRAICP